MHESHQFNFMEQKAMNDKELLELAAKAAGIAFYWHGEILFNTSNDSHHEIWNPLTDDGDALRLAVKLKMCIDTGVDDDTSFAGSAMNQNGIPDIIKHGSDPYAATRRAIVRAAAEIGRSIK